MTLTSAQVHQDQVSKINVEKGTNKQATKPFRFVAYLVQGGRQKLSIPYFSSKEEIK